MGIKICIIGCGNISNTRHIPALKKNPKAEIVGLISAEIDKIQRTIKKHRFPEIIDSFVLDPERDPYEQLCNVKWFLDNIDAVIIGTPPQTHYDLAIACLKLKKHVLLEKPMMMNSGQCDEAIELARESGVVLGIMHSFQFSNGMITLSEKVNKGELGSIKSILEVQLTNRKRRLPLWYDELPLGLFYDESAHFFYCANRFGDGDLRVSNANAVFNKDENTPLFLQAQVFAGSVPVQMYMNFNSPICEWFYILIGDEKIALYDYFKDILVVLDNDGEHLSKNVLKTSLSFVAQFWKGFIINGIKMLSGKLLYGQDVCVDKYLEAINNGKDICFELSPLLGKQVVKAMNEVIAYAKNGNKLD